MFNATRKPQSQQTLVYVDDGGRDTALAILRRCRDTDMHVRSFALPRSAGHRIMSTASLAESRH